MAEQQTKLVYLGKAQVQGSPVSISDVGSNKLAVMTNRYTLSLMDKSDARIGASATLIKETKYLHNYTKCLGASSKRDVAIVADGSKEVTILSFATGSFAKKADIKLHNESVEVISFSKDGSKFASGDIEGCVHVFDTKKYSLIFSLDKLGDYTASIVFSDDSKYIVSASYNKSITIYDTDRTQRLQHSAVNGLIEKMAFIAEDKIFFITRDQGAGIYDMAMQRVITYKTHFVAWPTSLALTSDKRYAFIGTKSNYLYVIRLSDNEKVLVVKLNSAEGVSSLCIESGRLYIGYSGGDIEVVDVEQSVKELTVYLKSKEWEKASELCRKNSLLSLYPELLKAFDHGWKEVLPKAIAAISRGNIDVATAICKPFLEDDKRASEFKFYVAQSKKVAEFVHLVEQRDYTKAYNLTMSAPFLKKTPTYDLLEKYWEKAFEAAKKMLDEDPVGNRLAVQSVLKPFAANVVTKPRISGLMNNFAKYIEADKLLKIREFGPYFELCARHAFLKDTQTYKKTVLFGEQLYDKLHVLEAEGKYSEALQVSRVLAQFPAYMALVSDRITYLSDLVGFLELVDNAIFGDQDAIKTVFEIASLQPKFQTLKEFQLLTKRFQDIAEAAIAKIPNGEPEEILNLLGVYVDIAYWHHKIKEIMRHTYLAEMKKAAKDPNTKPDWEIAFETYMSLFGKDKEIETFATQIKRLDDFKNLSSSKISDIYGYPKSIFPDMSF